MSIELILLIVLGAAVVVPYSVRHARRERRSREAFQQALAAGHEPASLHPVVDPRLCIGSAACVAACPEGDVLGVVDGHAVLANPTHCIGHGACLAACPVEAIELVFGSARRGVEIPHVKPNFETNVNGLFVAGELGGMGLIRNAMTQGMQAVEGIAAELEREDAPASERRAAELDLVIVGAGPAGLAAALAAKAEGLSFEIVDQEAVGGTVYHYPRKKLVMTQPIRLPFYGTLRAREVSKEDLLAVWTEVIRAADLRVRTGERVDAIGRDDGVFTIRTGRTSYTTRRVLLAIGRRGSPRKLGVPGEEAPHVAYSLGDPGEFRGDRVLVVGGGNSALEAAAELADPELGNQVMLSYRGEVFSRVAEKNRRRVEELERRGRLGVMLRSNVRAIHPDAVDLEVDGRTGRVAASRVFVFAGGVLPTAFLKQLGVRIDTKFGTR